jgi:hypothetical protein
MKRDTCGASANIDFTAWTMVCGPERKPFPDWSLKVEYLFVQFATIADAFIAPPPAGAFSGLNTRPSENIMRVGFYWRVKQWVPVA